MGTGTYPRVPSVLVQFQSRTHSASLPSVVWTAHALSLPISFNEAQDVNFRLLLFTCLPDVSLQQRGAIRVGSLLLLVMYLPRTFSLTNGIVPVNVWPPGKAYFLWAGDWSDGTWKIVPHFSCTDKKLKKMQRIKPQEVKAWSSPEEGHPVGTQAKPNELSGQGTNG